MSRNPTDYELLKAIHRKYYSFEALDGQKSSICLPIDIGGLAQQFGVREDFVYVRLYYCLDDKYGRDASTGHLFRRATGQDCVNFPLLDSVLAVTREKKRLKRRQALLSPIAELLLYLLIALFVLIFL